MIRFHSTSILLVAGLLPTLVLPVGWAAAAPATIGLSAQARDPNVIQGGYTKIDAQVRNLAEAGSDDLEFTIEYVFSYGTSTLPDQTLVADGGTGFKAYFAPYESTGQPLGTNVTTVRVTDPNATNSPLEKNVTVGVVSHSHPWIQWEDLIGNGGVASDSVMTEPRFSPEKFAATGGGEFYPAAAGHIFNRPNSPTASLDLDTVSGMGDPELTADFGAFANLLASYDPNDGIPFTIFLDTTNPGTFSKKFSFGFSDENLPGATAPASVLGSFTVTITVVPEPASLALLGFGAGAMLLSRKRW